MTVFPVIASTISEKELGAFAKAQYGLHDNYDCKLFRTGMNHTYMLSDTETTYVLRVYSHNWRSKSEINEEIALLNRLREAHLGVSFPIPDKNGTYIQEIQAPEGMRYVVLFSFAEGDKIRFTDQDTCFAIGALMANIHKQTANTKINRISYDKKSLIEQPYEQLKPFFSETLPAMEFIKGIRDFYQTSDFKDAQTGVVHLDIWYDNMAITQGKDVTIYDFDFCGNGAQVLDIGYFCKQLFHIETDKNTYELKKTHLLDGYQSIRQLSDRELQLIPKAALAVHVFYLGVQAQRFDWSNIFLSKNYLEMFYVARLKSWISYNAMEKNTETNS